MESHILKLLKGDRISDEATKHKMRKDMQYKNNVMTNKKEYPLNKVKTKPRNDQKLLTIRNKIFVLDNFKKHVEQVIPLMMLGGTDR